MLRDDTVKKLTTILVLLSLSSYALADMMQPSNYCSPPSKPYEFTSQYEVDSFNSGAKQYKKCISDFVDEQAKAVSRHQAAASDAIDEWNKFVR